jgi:hypothetical protein
MTSSGYKYIDIIKLRQRDFQPAHKFKKLMLVMPAGLSDIFEVETVGPLSEKYNLLSAFLYATNEKYREIGYEEGTQLLNDVVSQLHGDSKKFVTRDRFKNLKEDILTSPWFLAQYFNVNIVILNRESSEFYYADSEPVKEKACIVLYATDVPVFYPVKMTGTKTFIQTIRESPILESLMIAKSEPEQQVDNRRELEKLKVDDLKQIASHHKLELPKGRLLKSTLIDILLEQLVL